MLAFARPHRYLDIFFGVPNVVGYPISIAVAPCLPHNGLDFALLSAAIGDAVNWVCHGYAHDSVNSVGFRYSEQAAPLYRKVRDALSQIHLVYVFSCICQEGLSSSSLIGALVCTAVATTKASLSGMGNARVDMRNGIGPSSTMALCTMLLRLSYSTELHGEPQSWRYDENAREKKGDLNG
eukprot:IDg10857t1